MHTCSARAALRGAAAFGLILALAPAAGALAACPGYSQCPDINYRKVVRTNPDAVSDIAQIEAAEVAALNASTQPGLSNQQAKEILGAILYFDQNLSANHNEACAFCHMASSGFTGGIGVVNQYPVSYPGSVAIRTGNRKPPSAAYAAFAPTLYYRASTKDFVGGTFWDDRATGLVTGQPTADQAMGPPTNPLEMALPDHACAILRISQAPYANFFTQVWGTATLAITWPHDANNICSKPGEGGNPQPVQLSPPDRATAEASYVDMALSIAAFEATPSVSPFTSKFDAVQAGAATFTGEEALGYELFTGKAKCTKCHAGTGTKPLFTDFTAVNIGVPLNPNNPFFHENVDNGKGLVANPAGTAYVDDGLGGYLASAADTNPQWQALAPNYVGTFQVATLRNVAAQPYAGFVKSYAHNGYFKDLKTLVHFYNTRDVLPVCGAGGVVGVTCWPAPEQPANLNHGQTGNLGLSDSEESAIVTFLGTLTDGYTAN